MQPRNKKISQARKGKNKAGAGRPLSCSEDLDMELCQWVLEMHDLHLPIQRKHIQRKAIALIQSAHTAFHLDFPVFGSKVECAEVLIVGKDVKGVINLG